MFAQGLTVEWFLFTIGDGSSPIMGTLYAFKQMPVSGYLIMDYIYHNINHVKSAFLVVYWK